MHNDVARANAGVGTAPCGRPRHNLPTACPHSPLHAARPALSLRPLTLRLPPPPPLQFTPMTARRTITKSDTAVCHHTDYRASALRAPTADRIPAITISQPPRRRYENPPPPIKTRENSTSIK